ncbi:tubulin polyglutamylase complex subunit 2 isoform X1 [Parasteatoda tepidariorum]|uniref:tubulin polyglutamylase complex subunit 2 isoform X1 n=1 Tax=Parasteatoda tepidariorum TaxID=114398 RepID=UPI00077F9758|nr:tubulin polyglutamylase complex subunit 2 isoform X1 [Parasteatoda tepidariorum]
MDRTLFIDNLTLGIVKYFEKLPCVKSTVISEKAHVQEAALTAWEQKNGCTLPQDLKNFYLATDGLQIKWFWKQRGETLPCGVIEIARLSHLKSIGPKRQSANSELPSLLDIESDSDDVYDGHSKPKFRDGCKIFVIDHCQGIGKVCLIYPKRRDSSGDGNLQQPSIWFLDRALDFHYLTSDFASYYRLALAHLGIPQWQLLFTPYGPPVKTRLLLNMFAPERLVQKIPNP